MARCCHQLFHFGVIFKAFDGNNLSAKGGFTTVVLKDGLGYANAVGVGVAEVG